MHEGRLLNISVVEVPDHLSLVKSREPPERINSSRRPPVLIRDPFTIRRKATLSSILCVAVKELKLNYHNGYI